MSPNLIFSFCSGVRARNYTRIGSGMSCSIAAKKGKGVSAYRQDARALTHEFFIILICTTRLTGNHVSNAKGFFPFFLKGFTWLVSYDLPGSTNSSFSIKSLVVHFCVFRYHPEFLSFRKLPTCDTDVAC